MALLIEHPIAMLEVACIGFWRNGIISTLLLNVVQDFVGFIQLIVFAIYSPFLAPALWGCALITVEV